MDGILIILYIYHKIQEGFNKKVDDVLCRSLFTVQEVKLQSTGIEDFKDMYVEDLDFAKTHKVCSNCENHFHSQFSEFTLQNGFWFKGKPLCVPRGSMRENLIQEILNGSISGHFGLNKTLDLVERFYYWPKMQRDVRRYVEQCAICQKIQGTSSNVGLYQPFTIPNRPWK